MKLKILTDKERFLAPKKATDGSAAYDLYVQEDVIVKCGRQVIPTGFALELDDCEAVEIRPRSGFSAKGMEGYRFSERFESSFLSRVSSRFEVDVIHGLVDKDYRDELGVIIKSDTTTEFLIKRGTRIAQMLPLTVPPTKIEIVEELSETDRAGGFGSTGA